MKQSTDSKRRMCYIAEERIKYIVQGCTILVPSEYINRHSKVAGYIHWTICKRIGLKVTDRYWEHVSKKIINVNVTTIMWDVPAIADRTLLANRPDTLLTYLLTPLCRVLLEKLTVLQLVKKFPTFNGTRRFITALTSVRHLSLSWASPIQSTYPHPTSWRSILILSTHLRLGLPSGLFPSGFPTKTLYTPFSPIRATCPAHLKCLTLLHIMRGLVG